MEHNISYDKKLVLIKDLSEQCGREAAMEIIEMDPLPDGAFITNDFSAAVCMRTLIDNGIDVPGQIAIVGFINDAISKIIEPQLTTINYPGIDVGEIAARNLIKHLKGVTNMHQTKTIVVRSDLVIRKSSLKKLPEISRARV
jgi:LacI family transcriptional regulator